MHVIDLLDRIRNTVNVHIDHQAEEFPYLQLAAILRERVVSGQYAPGTKIPPLTAIAAESGLSVPAVRRAVGVLVREGLLRAVPGRGTFVPRNLASADGRQG
jgi:DNA-binding GntR family transcriptional regulator